MEEPQTIPRVPDEPDEAAPPPTATGERSSPRRIPNLGHALLFFALAGLLLVIIQALALAPLARHTGADATQLMTGHPKRVLVSEGAAYLATLAAAWLIFPRLWGRDFLGGIEWRGVEARRQLAKLIPLGLVLGVTVAGMTSYFTQAKSTPVDQMFASASDAWLITLFGTTLAPAFEEISFRGFLVPAFAIAYDWLSLPRTPEALERWRSGTALTLPALVFSAILSSVLFALLHGQQVGFQMPVLLALFCVSMVLTLIRIRTRSVACSALVHSAYNSLVFLAVIFQTGGYRHLERMKP